MVIVITPAQDRVVNYVTDNPGARSFEVARAIGPNGSARYGYAAINRAIAAGRITRKPDPARADWSLLFVQNSAEPFGAEIPLMSDEVAYINGPDRP